MFGPDFYPTPPEVIQRMIDGYDLHGKVVLEPSAGKGNIVDYLKMQGANVIACEKEAELRMILSRKCDVIQNDFLQLDSIRVSHVNYIIGNPPFSADEKHLNHAWEIAPPGCTIIFLCNKGNSYHYFKAATDAIIQQHGTVIELGKCFSQAERRTDVEVIMVTLQKPGSSQNEYEGFFMGEDAPEVQGNGLLKYNFVRDVVHRYITGLKIFDEQIDSGVRMSKAISQFHNVKLAFTVSEGTQLKTRNDFKKEMQKAAWHYIFGEMKLNKYSTKGLKEDINKFVEEKTEIPFTMRNIYQMLDIVIQTTGQRMDKALLEVFDRITDRADENKKHIEGWKTNSHYLLNRKFILPYIVANSGYSWEKDYVHPGSWSNSNIEIINDMMKALCYLTGENYDDCKDLHYFLQDAKIPYGKWSRWSCAKRTKEGAVIREWAFFEIKGFKKGTMHFSFITQELCDKFNREVARLKGYPLPEAKAPTSQAERKESARRDTETAKNYHPDVSAQPPVSMALMIIPKGNLVNNFVENR